MSVDEIRALKPTGIVLSPGPKTPQEAGICLDLVKALHQEVPIFGVCLGHQVLAEAFGGRVIHAEAVIHGKPATIFHRRQELFAKMPLPFQGGRYHSLIVERSSLPKSLMIEAETEQGTIMAMKHVEYPLYGVQFHPESILTPEGQVLIEAF